MDSAQSGGSSETDEKIPFANAVRFLAMTDEDHNEKTPEHYKWKFDNTSIFGCTFLNTLTYQKRVELLEELCGIASDASKENRKQQERTIALLSYYLCEGTEITRKWQEKLFYAAYSRDLYPIQETMWEYLRVSCPFYKKRIAGALRDACTFDKDKQFSKESPYYILLGWDRRNQPGKEEQIFLWESCRYKHHSWFGNPKEGWDYEDAFRKIKAAVKKLKNIKELRDEVLAYVYSLDLLLLAISNVKGRPSDAHYLMEKDVRNLIIDEREVFLEAVVLGDYYTRRFNRVYNQKDPQSWKNELFLLSGPIRFLCMYYDLFAGTKINLSETRWKAYQGWYCNKEFGRWKVLLTRLLSFTDFFDSPAVKALNKAEYNSSDFLEYDNLPDLYDEFMKQCSIKCSD